MHNHAPRAGKEQRILDPNVDSRRNQERALTYRYLISSEISSFGSRAAAMKKRSEKFQNNEERKKNLKLICPRTEVAQRAAVGLFFFLVGLYGGKAHKKSSSQKHNQKAPEDMSFIREKTYTLPIWKCENTRFCTSILG